MLRLVRIASDGNKFTAEFPITFQNINVRVRPGQSGFPSGGIDFQSFMMFNQIKKDFIKNILIFEVVKIRGRLWDITADIIQMTGSLKIRKSFQVAENALELMTDPFFHRKTLEINAVIRIQSVHDMTGIDKEVKTGTIFLIKFIQNRF